MNSKKSLPASNDWRGGFFCFILPLWQYYSASRCETSSSEFSVMLPSLTMTVMLLLTAGAAVEVTVMMAVPLLRATSRPLASTVATLVSDEVYCTPFRFVVVGTSRAINCTVLPTLTLPLPARMPSAAIPIATGGMA